MKRAAIASVLLVAACNGGGHESYAEYGGMLAQSPTIANSRYNAFACTTCHAVHEGDAAANHRIYPGGVLEGAASRPSWWGGNVVDLSVAVDDCFEHFMQGARLDPASDTAQALDAYLADLASRAPATTTRAVSFTVPPAIHDLPIGNATSGADLYARACVTCHGALHASGAQLGRATVIPDDTINSHCMQYGPAATRQIFIEKIRHGSFLGFPGNMPPFSMELLSDADVSDLLAYVGAPGDGFVCPVHP